MPTKVKKVKVKVKKETKQKQKQKHQKQTQIVNINISDKKRTPRKPTPSIQRLNQAYQATPTIINNLPMPPNELLAEMRNIVLQHNPIQVPVQTTAERDRNFIRNVNDLNREIQPEARRLRQVLQQAQTQAPREAPQTPQTPPIQRRNEIEEEPINVFEEGVNRPVDAGVLVPLPTISPKPRGILSRVVDFLSPSRRRRNRDVELGDIEDNGAGVLFRGDGGAGGNGGVGGVGDRGVGGIVGNEGARGVYYRGNREISTIVNRVVGEVGIERFRQIVGGGRPMSIVTAENNVRLLGRSNNLEEGDARRLHRSIHVLLRSQGLI